MFQLHRRARRTLIFDLLSYANFMFAVFALMIFLFDHTPTGLPRWQDRLTLLALWFYLVSAAAIRWALHALEEAEREHRDQRRIWR